tara:strand:+ start:665 stop:952 length:288 start_codon:yes stop_codon:yes gene_type:complete
MPTPSQQKALKDGLISQNQYSNLPSHLLDGIIRKKRASASPQKKTTTKGRARKGAMAGSRLAFDDTKQEKKKVGRGRSRRKRSGIKAGGENIGYN